MRLSSRGGGSSSESLRSGGGSRRLPSLSWEGGVSLSWGRAEGALASPGLRFGGTNGWKLPLSVGLGGNGCTGSCLLTTRMKVPQADAAWALLLPVLVFSS